MGFHRKWVLPLTLALLLSGVLALSALLPALGARNPGEGEAEQRVGLVLDKLGVTQKEAVLAWLSSSVPADSTPEGDLPVWTSRTGKHYHSFPLCGGLKSPVETTLGEAAARGLTPCPDCW